MNKHELMPGIVSARKAVVAMARVVHRKKKRTEPLPSIPPEVERGARHEFTDAGNSLRFTEDHRDKLVYVYGPGWFKWTGRRWEAQGADHERVLDLAKQTARGIRREIAHVDDHDLAIEVLKWARSSSSAGRLAAMAKLAAAGETRGDDLKRAIGQIDQNADILNTPSGIVDLRTGELRVAERGEYCTRITSASYRADADPRSWERLLELVLPDAEVRDAFQKVCGVGATGHAPKVIAVPVGPSNTGKTTVTEAISRVLGSYAGTALEATFTNARAESALYDLAELRGKRWVVFSETRDGHGLANERLKRATGGESIAARSPYGKPFDFAPSWLLVCPTNHPPVIASYEDAMYERIWPFPFEVNVVEHLQSSDEKVVDNYGATFAKKHGPAILRWLVEGAQRYYRDGLGSPPDALEARRAEWRDRDNVVKRWLDEQTEPGPSARERNADLWRDFQEWCRTNGEEPLLRNYRSQRFHAEMDDHYPRGGDVNGSATRLGVQLRRPPDGTKIVRHHSSQ